MPTKTLSWVTSSWFGHQSFHCLLITFADSETCFYWYVKDFEEFSTTVCVHAKSLQSCPTLYDPMDCSPLGFSVHGILQARILAWVAMPSSRGSSQPRDRILVFCVYCIASRFFTTEPLGKLIIHTHTHTHI